MKDQTIESTSHPPPQLIFDDGSRIMPRTPSTEQIGTEAGKAAPTTAASPRGELSIETYYEVDRLAHSILDLVNGNPDDGGWLCRVALQFPDDLLADAPHVCWAMEEALLGQQQSLSPLDSLVFCLGDTTFGPCCPDEVSALHLNADVLVHYGHACLSPAMSLPVLYSFGMAHINVRHCVDTVLRQIDRKDGESRRLILLYEVKYRHAMEALRTQLTEREDIRVVAGQIPEPSRKANENGLSACCDTASTEQCGCIDAISSSPQMASEVSDDEKEDERSTTFVVGGLQLPADLDLSLYTLLFVGDPSNENKTGTGSRQYINTMLRFLSTSSGPTGFWTYSPANLKLETELPSHLQRQLNRRFYLTQKARDASVFGILVGTLSQRHFRSVVSSLRRVIEDSGRSSYTFAVGKINEAKLANFGEIECYVLVACGENSLLNGERDFHVPVITPLELNMALGNVEWGSSAYSLDYNDFLATQTTAAGSGKGDDDGSDDAPYFSLVRGRYMERKVNQDDVSLNLAALPGKGQLTAYKSEASNFLTNREYKGLETKLGETKIQAAVPGQVGIASKYRESA